jgi:hypothetical protein
MSALSTAPFIVIWSRAPIIFLSGEEHAIIAIVTQLSFNHLQDITRSE